MLVQALIQTGHVDVHVGMILLHPGDALGRGDQVHQADVGAAPLLDQGDGVAGGTAGGQHGIQHQQLAVLAVGGQLAVVLHGLMGFGVAVQADVTNPCGGDQLGHGFHHAQARTQNRHDAQLLAGQLTGRALADGGLDLHLLGGQVAGHLVHHQHGDLVEQLAELLGAGILAAHDGQLVLDQGMVKDNNFSHECASLRRRRSLPACSTLISIRHYIASCRPAQGLFQRGFQAFGRMLDTPAGKLYN